MNYLVVVAHPDDEVLGAGATIKKLSTDNNVYVCILSGEVDVRNFRPTDEELEGDISESNEMLGVKKVIQGSFPNIRMNTVAHVELVKFIEQQIEEFQIDSIITHHPSDMNNDHYHVSIACQAASKLFQRKDNVKPLKELLYMEVLSSTEWAVNPSYDTFSPNVFVEVGEENIDVKIEALSKYRGVMREYPHPRSPEALKGLALYRGAQSGMKYAEAFQSAFRRGL